MINDTEYFLSNFLLTEMAFRQSSQKDTEEMRGRETFEHEFVQNKFKTIEMGIK